MNIAVQDTSKRLTFGDLGYGEWFMLADNPERVQRVMVKLNGEWQEDPQGAVHNVFVVSRFAPAEQTLSPGTLHRIRCDERVVRLKDVRVCFSL